MYTRLFIAYKLMWFQYINCPNSGGARAHQGEAGRSLPKCSCVCVYVCGGVIVNVNVCVCECVSVCRCVSVCE